MVNGPRIKIFTRSFDLRLYRRSKALYEGLGYPVVRLTDCSADGYFYRMLKEPDCDIAINIDEDAFLIDPAVLEDLIQTVIAGAYANAGRPARRRPASDQSFLQHLGPETDPSRIPPLRNDPQG